MLAAGWGVPGQVRGLEPIPDKLAVLTFDDSVASHYHVVRPLLKELGFGATFFITEGFGFRTNKQDYLTWEQIAELHRDGFEIGNHTRDHLGITADTLGLLGAQLDAIQERCVEHGIPRPTSFSWPGNSLHPGALAILRQKGFRFARRGGQPEHPYEWGRGFAYEPGVDHPLLIPSAGDSRPDWVLADFQRAVDQARDGKIAVLQFHGVPDRDHPWVNTPPERFREYLKYLKDQGFRVIALRDLARYVDPDVTPADPFAAPSRRRAARTEVSVEGRIVDANGGAALPARLYLRGEDGTWYFPKSTSLNGGAVRYERRNGSNTNAVEMHTALSAHPFRIELKPGRYHVRVEHGKEWIPEERTWDVAAGRDGQKFTVELQRLVNLAERGWYSGDTHIHRDPAELPIPMLAEDVNVVHPMTDWTTASAIPPSASPQSLKLERPPAPVAVDATHVWYPRNTEYEIFRTGDRPHTLGAVVLIGHRDRFDVPVFPLREVARRARAEGGLIDLEKHNWPWSIAMVPYLPVDLFELANNHHWQTEYAVRNWAVPAPAWMGLEGTGTDTELGWTLYGFRTWYALMNCGFALRPTAGTAHGVHPVPLGFGRVYVHLDGAFDYAEWMKGLNAGRSFVTTGPLLLATANGVLPGGRFRFGGVGAGPSGAHEVRVAGEIHSLRPLKRIEYVRNGEVVHTQENPSTRHAATSKTRSWVTSFGAPISVESSSWLAVRCWEEREPGRLRFAHTAAWSFEVDGKPLEPKREEAAWGVARAEEEVRRNEKILPPEALEEYAAALRLWQAVLARAK